MENLFSWDTLSKFLIAILGFALGEFRSYMQSRRGRWILVEKISEDLIFTNPPALKEKHSIEITANGVPITSIVQTRLHISNTGVDITEPIKIYLSFKKQNADDSVVILGAKAKGLDDYLYLPPESLEIRKEFFNSSKAYGEAICLILYSDHPLKVNVDGGGKGWKTKFVDRTHNRIWRLINALNDQPDEDKEYEGLCVA